MSDTTISKDDFAQRFTAEMLRLVGPATADGQSVAEYAEITWESYWRDPRFRQDGPEACANIDLEEWGDE
jgi:hypothetical protein